jgi:hypothetical protein
MENIKTQQKLIKIAGLWKNDSNTAIKSMKFEQAVAIEPGMKLIIMPNKKQHDRQPDYQAFLSPIEGQVAQAPQFTDDIPF